LKLSGNRLPHGFYKDGASLPKICLLLAAAFIFLALISLPAQAARGTNALRFYNRGEALARQGQVEAAIKAFDQAVRLAPGNAGMRARLAWLLLDQNQPRAALPHFQRLLAQRPSDRGAISGMAISYLKLGQIAAAVAVLDRGLRFHPRETLLLKLKAEALSSRAGTAGQAVQVYDELLQIQPGNAQWVKGRSTAARLAAAHSYDEAKSYLGKGNRTAALKAFDSALRFNPESVGYRTHYAWTLLEDGQLPSAAQNFQEVLDRDPLKRDAYLGLSLAQLRQKEPAAALATARRGLAHFPDDPQLLEVLAGAARGRPETLPLAVDTYKRLQALRPTDYRPSLRLAELMFEQGRINQAEKWYQEVLRQDPENAEANLGLARLNRLSDAYGQARFYYEKALAAAPANREAATGLRQVQELMRPQLQTHVGALEDSESFRRSYIYSGFLAYLLPELRAAMGYGYLNYTMGNNPLQGRNREHSVHRHILPLELNYRPFRQLVLELGGAFSDYGVWGQSGSGRAAFYYQATAGSGFSLSYAYYDVIDYYGPFKGPWGRQVDEFADMDRYRYLVIDPTAMWTQNIFGASSTQAITDRIRAHEVAFWGYQTLFSRLILSLYGSASPYNDGNFRKNLGTTVTYRVLADPLLKLKYSFFYLGFRTHSIDLANLPRGSAPLYWDPIAFKNHSWGVVFEQNWLGRLKLALESDLLYTPGAQTPGALIFLEVDLLLTRNLALRTVGFYLNGVDPDQTSYQLRSISLGLSYRF
jgi:tetratricopeptide (TPR) repeat protein